MSTDIKKYFSHELAGILPSYEECSEVDLVYGDIANEKETRVSRFLGQDSTMVDVLLSDSCQNQDAKDSLAVYLNKYIVKNRVSEEVLGVLDRHLRSSNCYEPGEMLADVISKMTISSFGEDLQYLQQMNMVFFKKGLCEELKKELMEQIDKLVNYEGCKLTSLDKRNIKKLIK